MWLQYSINKLSSCVQIRGILWQQLCVMLLVRDVKQFSFQLMPKSVKQFNIFTVIEREFHVFGALMGKAFDDQSR